MLQCPRGFSSSPNALFCCIQKINRLINLSANIVIQKRNSLIDLIDFFLNIVLFKVLFQLSKFDNIQFTSNKNIVEIQTSNEEECAMHCLQSSFCNHFVYRTLDPTKISTQKNCNLATNTYENLIDCRLDSICANLASCKYFYLSIILTLIIRYSLNETQQFSWNFLLWFLF